MVRVHLELLAVHTCVRALASEHYSKQLAGDVGILFSASLSDHDVKATDLPS